MSVLGINSYHMNLQIGTEAGQSDLMASGLMEGSSSIKLFLNSQQVLYNSTPLHVPVIHRRTSHAVTSLLQLCPCNMRCLLSRDIRAKFSLSTLVANMCCAMRRNFTTLEQARRQVNVHLGLHLRNYGI